MKERSLAVFTVLSQLAVGALWFWAVAGWATGQPVAAGDGWTLPVLGAVLAVMLSGLAASFLHLGAPSSAWRACSNLRSSWLSREILCASLFAGVVAALIVLLRLDAGTAALRRGLAGLAALLGLLLLACMAQAYRLRTVPAWDTWITPASFAGTALLLGSLGVGAGLAFAPADTMGGVENWRRAFFLAALMLLGLQLALFRFWMTRWRAPRRISHLARIRVALGGCGLVLLGALLVAGGGTALPVVAFGVVLGAETAGRLLFYETRTEREL